MFRIYFFLSDSCKEAVQSRAAVVCAALGSSALNTEGQEAVPVISAGLFLDSHGEEGRTAGESGKGGAGGRSGSTWSPFNLTCTKGLCAGPPARAGPSVESC